MPSSETVPQIVPCTGLERALHCEGQGPSPGEGGGPDHVFISNQLTHPTLITSLEEAPMPRSRPEPQWGPNARACLHEGQTLQSAGVDMLLLRWPSPELQRGLQAQTVHPHRGCSPPWGCCSSHYNDFYRKLVIWKSTQELESVKIGRPSAKYEDTLLFSLPFALCKAENLHSEHQNANAVLKTTDGNFQLVKGK